MRAGITADRDRLEAIVAYRNSHQKDAQDLQVGHALLLGAGPSKLCFGCV